ncbi:unnamed protein product, partial [Coregonus sp. 'balchen']
AGHRSSLVEVSPLCQLSTADWPVLCRDPSPKGSPPSLENGATIEICHSQWKSNKAPYSNVGLLGDDKLGPDTDQKQLCRPGSRGSKAFFLMGFQFEIGSGGTCAFVLCSVSLSACFYLWFRSSELPPSDFEAA